MLGLYNYVDVQVPFLSLCSVILPMGVSCISQAPTASGRIAHGYQSLHKLIYIPPDSRGVASLNSLPGHTYRPNILMRLAD